MVAFLTWKKKKYFINSLTDSDNLTYFLMFNFCPEDLNNCFSRFFNCSYFPYWLWFWLFYFFDIFVWFFPNFCWILSFDAFDHFIWFLSYFHHYNPGNSAINIVIPLWFIMFLFHARILNYQTQKYLINNH